MPPKEDHATPAGDMPQKWDEVWTLWFLGYAIGQTKRQACLSQYSMHPYTEAGVNYNHKYLTDYHKSFNCSYA